MRRTTIHLMLTLAVLGVYSGVLLWTGPTSHVERFPFFKWQLFSKVPTAVKTGYGVRVLEVDGKELDPPRYFESAPDLFAEAKAPEAATLLASWGGHIVAGRDDRAEFGRALFEARFLEGVSSARYQVVQREYDVIDRIDCECYLSEEVLVEHSYG